MIVTLLMIPLLLSLSLHPSLSPLYIYALSLALNLGVPKLQQQSSPSTSQSNNSGGLPGNSGGSSAASSTTSGSSKTSKSSQPSMNTPTAAFMAPTDLIQFPASAFHSPHGHAMRPPSGGQGAYISASAPPPPSHPSSMNMKFSAPQSLSSSTIAKPTPIPASATSSGIVRPTPKSVTNSQGAGAGVKREQQPTSASSKGVMSSSATKGEPPSTSVNLMYGFAPHPMMSYGILNAAAAAAVTATPPSHGQLSKMLLGGSQHPSSHPPPPPSSASRSSKSDGSNGSSKAAASQGNATTHEIALIFCPIYSAIACSFPPLTMNRRVALKALSYPIFYA